MKTSLQVKTEWSSVPLGTVMKSTENPSSYYISITIFPNLIHTNIIRRFWKMFCWKSCRTFSVFLSFSCRVTQSKQEMRLIWLDLLLYQAMKLAYHLNFKNEITNLLIKCFILLHGNITEVLNKCDFWKSHYYYYHFLKQTNTQMRTRTLILKLTDLNILNDP